jgi:division protein CdvB (Snf7/Vps24/ESCRT-III family)
MPLRLRRRGRKPAKIVLLEASVAARIAAAKLTMLIKRVQRVGAEQEHVGRLVRMLTKLQLALEAISLRLETLAVTSALSVEELSAVREAVRMLEREFSTVVPGIKSVVQEIENAVTEVAALAGLELETSSSSSISELARRILDEAEKAVEERLRILNLDRH